ncbi:hypothetical protein Dimus_001650 [Dionaea muscipula]
MALHSDDEFELRGYQVDAKDMAFELDGNEDSKEYWLFQWPVDQPLDLTQQEVTLTLDENRQLCCFEGPSGKKYNVVNVWSKEPGATVYLSSLSQSTIVGKISSCAAFVHYPEAEEIEKLFSNDKKLLQPSLSIAGPSSLGYKTPQRTRWSNPKSRSSGVTSTHSSGKRSSLPEIGKLVSSAKRTVTVDSGRGKSAFTKSVGSAEFSHQKEE